MSRRTTGLTTIFALLLVVTTGGILYHFASGYHYPVSAAADYEINVLGDIYELFIVVPVGLFALWLLRRGSVWGTLLMTGVAVHFTYNYAMILTGRQNLWVFVWVAKLALSGVALCLLWNWLPATPYRSAKASYATAGYLTLVLLAFTKMMGDRLWASATGRAVDMTMQGAGVLDWGEPFLRDPIVFFSFALPIVVTAILGLLQRTDWGSRATAFADMFITSMVTVILFTGPLKEYLQNGAVSPAMWSMSIVMLAAAAPAVVSLVGLAKGEPKVPAGSVSLKS